MKKLLIWIGGFFSSESGTSSKRLVGIVGAFSLFYTLYDNSKTHGNFAPAESLVWGTVALSAVALGLTTIESVTNLIKGFKGNDNKKEEKDAIE
jgi:hypothetical protein